MATTLPYDWSTPSMELWEKLELTSSDPCRTAIVNVKNPQQNVYRAKTGEPGSNPVTTFTNEHGEIIATLEWRLYLSDKLSVRGGKKRSVGKWLENKRTYQRRCSSFIDERGNAYIWRSVGSSGSLQLFEGEDSTDPIALLSPSVPRAGDGQERKPTTILLSDHAEKGRDDILLSALLLERSRWLSKGNTTSPLSNLGAGASSYSVY